MFAIEDYIYRALLRLLGDNISSALLKSPIGVAIGCVQLPQSYGLFLRQALIPGNFARRAAVARRLHETLYQPPAKQESSRASRRFSEILCATPVSATEENAQLF